MLRVQCVLKTGQISSASANHLAVNSRLLVRQQKKHYCSRVYSGTCVLNAVNLWNSSKTHKNSAYNWRFTGTCCCCGLTARWYCNHQCIKVCSRWSHYLCNRHQSTEGVLFTCINRWSVLERWLQMQTRWCRLARPTMLSQFKDHLELATFCGSPRLNGCYPTSTAFVCNYTVISTSPVWAQECCRTSPPRFLAECRKRWLNQASFVLLYFVWFAFCGLCLVL